MVEDTGLTNTWECLVQALSTVLKLTTFGTMCGHLYAARRACNSSQPSIAKLLDVGVSQNRGTPIWTPKHYDPYYWDPQKGTLNFGKPPCCS